jgi:sarcosine oxidase subunit delta
MLLITCPYCGQRPEVEFRNMGEAHLVRPADPSVLDDAQWAEFLFYRANTRGVIAERWNHIHGCQRFFNALRDTVSDTFVTTYKTGEKRPDIAPEDAR